MVRLLNGSDLPALLSIHQKFHEKDFPFPSFNGHFLGSYAITDDNDKIIVAGGLEQIVEMIALHDMSRPITERREAFYKLLQCCLFMADKCGYDQVHCQPLPASKSWERHIVKAGFKPCKNRMYFADVK